MSERTDITKVLAECLWQMFRWPEFAPPEARETPEWCAAVERDLENWRALK